MSELPSLIKEAKEFSYKRKLEFPKKMTSEVFRTEVEAAHILGECCAYERILEFIRKNKDLTMDDLEAAIHLNLNSSLEATSIYYTGKKMFGLTDILETHGYYVKEESNVK